MSTPTTAVIIGIVAGAAWLIGRTDRPAVRREIRRQERAAARAHLDTLYVAADGEAMDAASEQRGRLLAEALLADANAALGLAQKAADQLPDPDDREAITAALTGREAALAREVAA